MSLATSAQRVGGTAKGSDEGVVFTFTADLGELLKRKMKDGKQPTPDEVLAEANAQLQRRSPGPPLEWADPSNPPSQKQVMARIRDGKLRVDVLDRSLKPVDAKTLAAQEAYAAKLGKGEREWLEGATNSRYAEKTHTQAPATQGDKVYREALRQQYLRLLQAVEGAPEHVRDYLLKRQDGPVASGPVDPEALRKVAAKLSALSPEEFQDFISMTTGATTDLGAVERSVDAFRKDLELNAAETARLMNLQTRVTTPEQLYKDYSNYKTALGLPERRAEAATKQLGQRLNEQLPLHGFKDLADYEKSLQDFRDGFDAAARSQGQRMLTRYEHDLFTAGSRYADTTGLDRELAPARELFAEAQALRAKADTIQPKLNVSSARLAGTLGEPGYKPAVKGDAGALRERADLKMREMQERLDRLAESHPLLARDPDFARRLVQAKPGETAGLMRQHLAGRREDIAKTRAELAKDPSFVHGLDVLLASTRQAQGLQPGSLANRIIDDHLIDRQVSKAVTDVAITGVLVSAGLLTGPGVVGVIASGIVAGGGIAQAKGALDDYRGGMAAHGSGLSSHEPSFGWVVLAMAGAAVDAAALTRAARMLERMTDVVREFNATKNVEQFASKLDGVKGLTSAEKAQLLKAAKAEKQLQEQLTGMLQRGGPLRVTGSAVPEARMAELRQLARTLAERGGGEASFSRFLRELKANKLIDGEPSPEAMRLLKQAHAAGVEEAEVARKAVAAAAERRVLEGPKRPKPSEVETPPAAKPSTRSPVVETPLAKPPTAPVKTPPKAVVEGFRELTDVKGQSASTLAARSQGGGLLEANGAQLRFMTSEGRVFEGTVTSKNAHDVLDLVKDADLRLGKSSGSYAVRQAILERSGGELDTYEAFTVGQFPRDQVPWKWLEDPANWVSERRELQQKLFASEVQKAQALSDRLEPNTVYALRGNTAAGKTTAVKNDPFLQSRILGANNELSGALNPDPIKAQIVEAASGKLSTSQSHVEGSTLSQRVETEMLSRPNSSVVYDKRFAGPTDIPRMLAAVGDRNVKIIDLEVPLETSSVRVLMRDPGTADPLVPFKAVKDGFDGVRRYRAELLAGRPHGPDGTGGFEGVFGNEKITDYKLLVTDSSGKQVLVAEKRAGKVYLPDTPEKQALYEKAALGLPDHEIDRVKKTIIDDAFIDRQVRATPPAFTKKMRARLTEYKGKTLEQALDAHAKRTQ
ncbi:hypothetical protein JYJ93_28500 [Corallococcus sp. NCSPR001]|nr:XopAJ/AvrRxo1 family type III secretion system effector zeta toxin [Corallococcus sp. NCSPR001]MBN9686398.1 hypothetical protein [Corallococcus sp. NCSPR001]